MTGEIVLSPLVPWAVLTGLAAATAALVLLALWRGLPGWPWRGLAATILLAALANPALREEQREPLNDVVLVVVDDTESQRIDIRPGQVTRALADLEERLAAFPGVETRVITLRNDPDAADDGSNLMAALAEGMAGVARDRVAGAFLITDGRIHDADIAPAVPAPVHVLLTGRAGEWDRRLVVRNAPAFAIVGEEISLSLRIEDQGAAPDAESTQIEIALNGEEPRTFTVPIGRDLRLPVTLQRGGQNVIELRVPEAEGELTTRNNAAVVAINGVRDRLRVLLVSGEPYPGERTWRNLLKSDGAVDLVHFTILRPPEKQDGVPVTELSLIAFPTRELFMEKIEEFDLIIFDRYRRRGILPSIYLDNIRRYVTEGGALLIASGPEFASAESLYRSPMGEVMPASPTGFVPEAGFTPGITEAGRRHPVTAGLEAYARAGGSEDGPPWGRWMRIVELAGPRGHVVMDDGAERPLLVLDRQGEGRVALLASDHAWLWDRGFEGGGPQLELLRRLAHWSMKEPDLEEEGLWARAAGRTITVTRRTMGEAPGPLSATLADGAETVLALEERAPGRFEVDLPAALQGLYRFEEGAFSTVIALGPAAPREFEATVASGAALEPLMRATRGGLHRLEEGMPDLRLVREGRPAAGRGWLGITPRGAYVTADIRLQPLVLAWAFLALAAALMLLAWRREGR